MIKYFYAGSLTEVEPEDKLCITRQVSVNGKITDFEKETFIMDPEDDTHMTDLLERGIITERDVPDKEESAGEDSGNDQEDASEEYFATLDTLLEHIVRHLEKSDKKIFELEDRISEICKEDRISEIYKKEEESRAHMIQGLIDDFFKNV